MTNFTIMKLWQNSYTQPFPPNEPRLPLTRARRVLGTAALACITLGVLPLWSGPPSVVVFRLSLLSLNAGMTMAFCAARSMSLRTVLLLAEVCFAYVSLLGLNFYGQ